MKIILITSSSLRNNSNSDSPAGEFARGAEDAGNNADLSFILSEKCKKA